MKMNEFINVASINVYLIAFTALSCVFWVLYFLSFIFKNWFGSSDWLIIDRYFKIDNLPIFLIVGIFTLILNGAFFHLIFLITETDFLDIPIYLSCAFVFIVYAPRFFLRIYNYLIKKLNGDENE